MRCPSRRQKNAFSDYFSQLLAKCPETTWRQPRRTACNRSDWHPEFADASKDRQDLSTIGSRGRPRKPELLDGASGAVGVLRLEGCGDLGGLVASPAQRQCRHQEQLRASITAVAFQGFLEQRDGRFGPADEQLGKSAEKEPDAVTAIGAVEPHGPSRSPAMYRRRCRERPRCTRQNHARWLIPDPTTAPAQRHELRRPTDQPPSTACPECSAHQPPPAQGSTRSRPPRVRDRPLPRVPRNHPTTDYSPAPGRFVPNQQALRRCEGHRQAQRETHRCASAVWSFRNSPSSALAALERHSLSSGARARQPELLECSRAVIRILLAE